MLLSFSLIIGTLFHCLQTIDRAIVFTVSLLLTLREDSRYLASFFHCHCRINQTTFEYRFHVNSLATDINRDQQNLSKAESLVIAISFWLRSQMRNLRTNNNIKCLINVFMAYCLTLLINIYSCIKTCCFDVFWLMF